MWLGDVPRICDDDFFRLVLGTRRKCTRIEGLRRKTVDEPRPADGPCHGREVNRPSEATCISSIGSIRSKRAQQSHCCLEDCLFMRRQCVFWRREASKE